MMESAQLGKIRHFTPLRYPGGKAKLSSYVKEILRCNRLLDGEYVEPYAGGAAIALELLMHEYVSKIHINDVSRPVYAFWASVLDAPEALCKLIYNTPLTVEEWDKQKAILRASSTAETLELGFATFYLNRTNRSGILNGGIIGGRDQTGPWKIDARYNVPELARRIESIASMRDRISLTRKDAFSFLSSGFKRWPEETLIYLDPPYFVKGSNLYLDFYEHADHEKIAALMKQPHSQKWIVSYDNVPEIKAMYRGVRHVTYDIGYSARSASIGSEIMFFGKGVKVPPLSGPIQMTSKSTDLRWVN